MAKIDLIATDLDNTLIGNMADISYYPVLSALLRQLKEENNAIWVISTGRPLKSFRKVFSPLRLMGLRPDFVITEHAYIHSLGRVFWLPHMLWNWRIRLQTALHNHSTRRLINECIATVRAISRRVRVIKQRDMECRLAFPGNEDAISASRLLNEKIGNKQHLMVFQSGQQVEIRGIPFTKGLALSELIRHVGSSSENTLAIGDGYNDLSMLMPEVARMVGCPLNSAPDVIEAVHNHGGHVASDKSLHGVVQIIQAFIEDRPDNSFPADWDSRSRKPLSRHVPSERSRHIASRDMTLAATMLAVALLVFAHFGLLPKSGLLTKPFEILVNFIARLVGALVD